MTNPYILPPDLPRPVDDGACNHLVGTTMRDITIPSTAGREVDVGALPPDRYRRTIIAALLDHW